MANSKVAALTQIDAIASDDWFLVSDTSATDNAKKASPANVKTGLSLANVTDDAQLKRSSGDFDSFSSKGSPISNDLVLIEDSAASYAKKKATVGSIRSNIPRAWTSPSQTSITPDIDTYDLFALTAETSSTLTINAPTGSAVLGRRISFMINASSTGVTVGFNIAYCGTNNVSINTLIASGETLVLEFMYDSDRSIWVAMSGGLY